MKVLVIGGGGREHAIVDALSRSPQVEKIYCAPGNAGIARQAECVAIRETEVERLRDFAAERGIGLTVVGPEVALAAGVVDCFRAAGLRIFGPTKAAARIESSKEFAKRLMAKYAIPTAGFRAFTDYAGALAYVQGRPLPAVLKYDGLAAGKGVLIVNSLETAKAELDTMLNGRFGHAGDTVVIEEFLSGIECSVFVATDGKNFSVLPVAKDYKRIGVGDTGPNTGGMGAVSPVPFADAKFMDKVVSTIVEPTVKGLSADKIDYKGFIFIGLMNVQGDPYVIEYNVRMGDPETEAVLPRIESDIVELFQGIAYGGLDQYELKITPATAATVVCVSGGYPGDYAKGMEIKGLGNTADSVVFHAGTTAKGGKTFTAGGRVLAVTSFGDNITDAVGKSYKTIEGIGYEGKYYRTDIGKDLL